jgi:hypothetical protein
MCSDPITLFAEIWPLIAARVKPDEFRAELIRDLLGLFLHCDVDPTDVAGRHPEVDAALLSLGALDLPGKKDEEPHMAVTISYI